MNLEKQKSALDLLFYEVEMFNVTSKHLRDGENDLLQRNVYLESFLIHTRNPVDFLEDDKFDDDIRCSDFNIQKTSVNLPNGNGKKEINKWLSHITKERIISAKPLW